MQSEEITHGGVALVMCRGRADLVRATLETIENQTVEPMWTLLIDTGTDKQTTKWLNQVKNESALLSVDSCIAESIAVCWNRALEWAFLVRERKEALVVDSSVELLPETYEVLVGKLRKHGLGMATAVRVEREDFCYSTERNDEYELSAAQLDFNCFMISKEAWDKAGPFDESQHGSEGHEMDTRMRALGIMVASVNVPYLHNKGGLFEDKHGARRTEGEGNRDRDGSGDDKDDDPDPGLGFPSPVEVY